MSNAHPGVQRYYIRKKHRKLRADGPDWLFFDYFPIKSHLCAFFTFFQDIDYYMLLQSSRLCSCLRLVFTRSSLMKSIF